MLSRQSTLSIIVWNQFRISRKSSYEGVKLCISCSTLTWLAEWNKTPNRIMTGNGYIQSYLWLLNKGEHASSLSRRTVGVVIGVVCLSFTWRVSQLTLSYSKCVSFVLYNRYCSALFSCFVLRFYTQHFFKFKQADSMFVALIFKPFLSGRSFN